MSKNVLVTGCAGFVGSNMCKKLIQKGYLVRGIDNFSTGKKKNIKDLLKFKNFRFTKLDLLKSSKLSKLFENQDIIFHFAANADVKDGLKHPKKDLQQNTIVTFNVLNAMRLANVKKIVFSSTGSIYGEPKIFPTKEDSKFPIQTSLYGASKLSCEGLIQAFCYGYDMKAFIYRFVSLFGEGYSHGHLYDFYKQLLKNPKKLVVLGDGNQKKSYLNINDCIDAIFLTLKKSKDKINIYNLGLSNFITVKHSINTIIKYMKLDPEIIYKGGKRGWIGDSPKIHLDINKILKLGWKPKKNIDESIVETLKFFQNNKWLFKE